MIRVGVTQEERSKPQLCRLDLTLYTDLRKAGRSADLKDTMDYAAAFQCVQKICEENAFVLLEEVGHKICREIFQTFVVGKVRLRISKIHPFSDRLLSAGIDITRKRKG